MQRDDDGFAQRIDGRIGDLRKALAEVRVDRPRRLRQVRERRVVAHGPHGVLAVGRHGRKHHAHVFLGIAEEALRPRDCLEVGGRQVNPLGGNGGVIDQRGIAAVGVEQVQQVIVLIDLLFLEIHDEHLPRSQAAAVNDGVGIEIDETRF